MDSEQYESKLILSEVPFGSHQGIAEDMGQSAGAISRKFNLNDELRNELGGARRLLRSLKVRAPKQYREALAFLGADSIECAHVTQDLTESAGRVAKEIGEALGAELERKPMCQVRKEWREAEIEVRDHNAQLRHKAMKLRKVG